jgi:hypothetical protein
MLCQGLTSSLTAEVAPSARRGFTFVVATKLDLRWE